jgi:hypothetical protein
LLLRGDIGAVSDALSSHLNVAANRLTSQLPVLET